MNLRKITKDRVVYAMSRDQRSCRHRQQWEVKCYSKPATASPTQITSADAVFNELDWLRINPATGPVFIEGAEPGDCLKVSIKRITP